MGTKFSHMHPPPFDQWVDYCFTLGQADFHSGWDGEIATERGRRFVYMDAPTIFAYMTRLLESPGFIADRYSDKQIGDGTWFLFGVASCFFGEIWSNSVQKRDQVRCIDAILTMYTDLFDHVCCRRAADPNGKHSDNLDIDGAVYMIWDMDSVAASLHDSHRPDLADAAFGVLEGVLNKCKMSTCIQSALHGLGHAHSWHPQRVERIVDAFLDTGRGPAWVREYALAARVGHVQ